MGVNLQYFGMPITPMWVAENLAMSTILILTCFAQEVYHGSNKHPTLRGLPLFMGKMGNYCKQSCTRQIKYSSHKDMCFMYRDVKCLSIITLTMVMMPIIKIFIHMQ